VSVIRPTTTGLLITVPFGTPAPSPNPDRFAVPETLPSVTTKESVMKPVTDAFVTIRFTIGHLRIAQSTTTYRPV
jgi:hypothetical protein